MHANGDGLHSGSMRGLEPVLSPVLVGRDEHLDLADRRIADVIAGHGHVLLFAGEAGIGKTRLRRAVARRAAANGLLEANGDLAPADHDVPMAIFGDLARSMTLTPGLEPLGRMLLARARRARTDAVYSRTLVLETVDLIRGVITGPIALGFEDLQWADDLSLEAIAELARAAQTQPLLVLASYRRDETPPSAPFRDWRSRLLTQRLAEEIRLERLSEAQTATVTTLLLGTGLPAPRDLVRAVHERSDGVPLHIEELMAAARARGPVDAVAIETTDVPDTIEDAVLARTACRSEAAQTVARAGAVLGRCFAPDVLAGVLDVPVADLEAPLQELVDHAILSGFGWIDSGYYDFRHQLLREALYASVPERERRRYHARAGEFGARLAGASEVHASLHYERAGLRREAYQAAVAGARDARRVAAHREAYVLLQRAADNLPDDVPALECAELFEALAGEAAAIEENDVAERMARSAAEAFREAGHPERAVEVSGCVLTVARRMGWPLSERRVIIDALDAEIEALAPGPAVDEVRMWSNFDRLVIEVDAMELQAARATAGRLGAEARSAGQDELELAVAQRVAMIDLIEGDVDHGVATLYRIAEEARAAGMHEVGVTAFRDTAVYAVRAFDYDAARRSIAEGLIYADSIQQSHCAHTMAAIGAELAWTEGRWDEAVKRAEQAAVDRGCAKAHAMAQTALGAVAFGRGEIERARLVLGQSLAFGEHAEQVEFRLLPRWGLAETALVAGDPAEAIRWSEEALALAQSSGERATFVPLVVTGTRGYLAANRPGDAERWVRACEAHLAPTPAFGAAALHHARGLVASSTGSTGAARTELEAAVAGWGAGSRLWEASLARLDLATVMTRTNRFATAVALAGHVRALAGQLGSPILAARADELIRQGRGRIVEDEPWRPLTSREYEVARLIAEGRTNVEIADELGIASKTASSHVEHILAKLGASRRAEIAAWAMSIERSPAAR